MICRPDLRFLLGFAGALMLAASATAAPEQPVGAARQWVENGRALSRRPATISRWRPREGPSRSGRPIRARLVFRGQLLRDAEGPAGGAGLVRDRAREAPGDMGLLGEYAATLGEAGRHRDMLRIARRMVTIDRAIRAPISCRQCSPPAPVKTTSRAGCCGARAALTTGSRAGQAACRRARLSYGQCGARGRPVRRADPAAARQCPGHRTARAGLACQWRGQTKWSRRSVALADRPDASPYLLTLVGRAYERLGRRADAARYLDRAAMPAPMALSVLARREGRAGALPDAAIDQCPACGEYSVQGRRGRSARGSGAARRPICGGSADVGLLAAMRPCWPAIPRGGRFARYARSPGTSADDCAAERNAWWRRTD